MRAEVETLAARFLDGELERDEEREALHRIADDEAARALLRFDLGVRGLLREGAETAVPSGFTDRVMAAIEAHDPVRAAAGAEPAEPAPSGAREGVPGRTAPASPSTGPSGGAADRLARWWKDLGRPRTLRWRPARVALAGVALVVVLAGVFLLGVVPAGPTPLVVSNGDLEVGPEGGDAAPSVRAPAAVAGETGPDTVLVRFVLEAPGAGSVAVAGDFSRWEPVPLARQWRDGEPVWSGLVAVPRGEHRYMFVVDGSRWVTDPLATTVRDDGFGNRNAILSL